MKSWALLAVMFLCACGDGARRIHGRISSMTALGGPDARAQGCNSQGSRAGAGFAAFADSFGGLDAYLSTDPIRWVLLLEAYPVQVDGELEAFDVRWLDGVHLGGDRFQIDYNSYVDSDPDAGGKQGFGQMELAEGGWISGRRGELTLPELERLGPTTLQEVALEARLLIDEAGLAVRGGILSGYLPRTALLGDDLPYDAVLSAAGASPCAEGAGCDALSVCVSFEAGPLPPERME